MPLFKLLLNSGNKDALERNNKYIQVITYFHKNRLKIIFEPWHIKTRTFQSFSEKPSGQNFMRKKEDMSGEKRTFGHPILHLYATSKPCATMKCH